MRERLAALLLFALGALAACNTTPVDWTQYKVATPGVIFDDCPGCPEMVVLPAGQVWISGGYPHGDGVVGYGLPVNVPMFAVSRYEITFEQFGRCVGAGVCPTPKDTQPAGADGGRHPVTLHGEDLAARGSGEGHLFGSSNYPTWLALSTRGQPYRLLSASEWEYAARGGTTTRYPWGDLADATKGNFLGTADGWTDTAPVGSFPANLFGLHDMLGNVREVVQDCTSEAGPPPLDGSARGGTSSSCETLRTKGGSYLDDVVEPTAMGVATHLWAMYDDRTQNRGNGIRVARAIKPGEIVHVVTLPSN